MRRVPSIIRLGLLLAFASAVAVSAAPREATQQGTPPSVQTVASDGRSVQLVIDLPDVQVQRAGEGDRAFDVISIPGGEIDGAVGAPALPAFTRLVAIPDDVGVTVTVTPEEEETLTGIRVIPMQAEEGDFAFDAAAYDRADYGNMPLASVGEPAILRDLRVAPLTVNPVRYNPADGTLKIYRRMRVDVRFEGADASNARARHTSTIAPSFDRLYRSVVVNYERSPETMLQPGSYIVICPNNSGLLTRIQPLLDWRQRQGYKVVVATTAETGTSASSIKAYLENAYATMDPKPEYVLLVGDAGGTYSVATWYENYSGYNGEGDHPYTQLDGTDPLADVHIGRLSISSLTELDLVVSKIVGYESDPWLEDWNWFTHAVLVGDPNQSGMSTVFCNQWVKDRLMALNYTQIDTIWGGDFDLQMRNDLNPGASLLTYRGWLGMSGWDNTDAYQLTNGERMCFAVILTCGTGSFASGTARSEGFLRANYPGQATQPTAGVGAIGTATTGTHTRYNNCIFYGILNGLLYDELYEFGAALTRGKLEMYMNYQEAVPNQVLVWSHWNNLMGDAATPLWTARPIEMQVTHPASIPLGTNTMTVTVNAGLFPSRDAQVCLWKGNEVHAVGYTNSLGQVELMIDPASIGDMQVTVTKHNHVPYLNTVPVTFPDYFVGYKHFTVDDDTFGASDGNGDGFVNPGETIELRVELENSGFQPVNGITATLSSSDPYVTVLDADESFGDLNGFGVGWCADHYTFAVDPRCPNDRVLRFHLDVSAGSDEWQSAFEIPIVSAELNAESVTLGNLGANGVFDPGETVTVIVEVSNSGNAPASDATMTLISEDVYVSVIDRTASFGTIYPGGAVSNGPDPFTIQASPSTYEGALATLMLVCEHSGDARDTTEIQIEIGNRSSNDPTGPDRYGYIAFDNTDTGYPDAPTYNWIELDPTSGGSGTEIVLNDFGEYQDKSTGVTLPFTFRYYGRPYNRVTVCSNGWLAMGSTYLVNYRNWTIPGAGGPNGLVAPFWDDLRRISGSPSSKVFQRYDSAGHRWIVEWSNMRNEVSGAETFQVILLDPVYYTTQTGDGIIIFQYQTVTNNDSGDNYATVGIENHDHSDGVLYSYYNRYSGGSASLIAGRAIKFVPTKKSPTGLLQGIATNSSFGNAPVPGVEIEVVGTGRTLRTGSSGTYSGPVLAGVYDIIARHPSFGTATVNGRTIADGQITTVNFSLVDVAGPTITATQHASTGDTFGPYEIPVNIVEYSGLADRALFCRVDGGAFTEVELTHESGNDYLGLIPGQSIPSYVQYYVWAQDGLGHESVDPPGAPTILHNFQVATETALLEDDFEQAHGWTAGVPDDNATSGLWIRAEPVGTQTGGSEVQPDLDHTADPGQLCFVTGNGTPGQAPDVADVDGGKTTLLSPVFDLTGYESAFVGYWVWYTNDRGPAPGEDYWDVDVTSDGLAWVHLQHTVASTNSWVQRVFDLSDYVQLSNQVRLRFVARDLASESTVEAAIDDFSLTAVDQAIGVPSPEAALAYGLTCHPNPFNPSVAVTYQIPEAGEVVVRILDVSGRVVRDLVNENTSAGRHEVRWDGRNNAGVPLASGIYFVRLESPGLLQIRQVTLLK